MKRKSRSVDVEGAVSHSAIIYCSFCGKSQHEVEKVVAGPSVFICSECVDLCTEIVVTERRHSSDITYAGSLVRYILKVQFDRAFEPKEANLLPALLQTLQSAYPGSLVSLKSFDLRKDGGILYVYFDSPIKLPAPEVKALEAEIESLSRQLKIEQEKYLAEKSERARFEDSYRDLMESVFPLLLNDLKRQGRFVDRSAKTMLIMFADIVGFSKLSNDDRSQKLDLMRVVARSVLKSENGLYLNTWGDGLIAAFDDVTQGLRCACKFVQHLNVDGIDVRVGVSWGGARVVYNEATQRMDIDGSSVNIGARIEPLASPGEVLASDIVASLPDLRREDFTFLEREVKLEKAVGTNNAGDTIKVFRVSYLPNR